MSKAMSPELVALDAAQLHTALVDGTGDGPDIEASAETVSDYLRSLTTTPTEAAAPAVVDLSHCPPWCEGKPNLHDAGDEGRVHERHVTEMVVADADLLSRRHRARVLIERYDAPNEALEAATVIVDLKNQAPSRDEVDIDDELLGIPMETVRRLAAEKTAGVYGVGLRLSPAEARRYGRALLEAADLAEGVTRDVDSAAYWRGYADGGSDVCAALRGRAGAVAE